MLMSIHEIYDLLLSVGFPESTAVKMTAVALKESVGKTDAFNGRAPDLSYGLWQINMIGNLGAARRARYGLARNEDLYNPLVNAKVAYDLWGGNDSNIPPNWGTNVEPFATSYRQSLARVERELGIVPVVVAGNVTNVTPVAGSMEPTPTMPPPTSTLEPEPGVNPDNPDDQPVSPYTWALAVLAALAAAYVVSKG
jgi:hypothetical protein